jgi:Flavin containing amine oxidoreductase
VEEIDWWQETVKVYTENEDGECVRYDAGRVLVTTSIGVMDKRGDDKYPDSRPMYSPNLEEEKMSALRELYIDESRSPTNMGEYRIIQFQFGTAFWNDGSNPDVQFISTQRSDIEVGKFRAFQNLDFAEFYKGSKALKGFLVTSDYDAVKGDLESDETTANARINELLAESIGRAYPSAYFDNGDPDTGTAIYNCLQTSPFGPFPAQNPPSGSTDCVWSFFGGENENWYGAYSHFEVTEGTASEAFDKYELVFEPLTPAKYKGFGDKYGKTSNTVWFSGSAYCDRHAEFVHGAYWAGIVAMNEMIDDWGYYIGTDNVTETDEYIFCFTGQEEE